jgi:pimeloyl-ACP methyl ester carboxylesterase
VALAAALAATVGPRASAGEEARPFADIDGAPIAYRHATGPFPAVVFDSGLGDGLESWDGVFPEIAKTHAALAWSRPGLGDSGPSQIDDDGVRTSKESARLLKRLLEEIALPPPYVLVGHSLGGLNVLKYAELYPDDVAAIILVDARPARFRARCAERKLVFCMNARVAPPDWPVAIRAEIAGTVPSDEDVAPPLSAGAIPVTVISSTRPWPAEGGAEAHAFWREAQEEFAAAFENGRFVRAEGAGHYVHKENPTLVISEIRLTVARLAGEAGE